MVDTLTQAGMSTRAIAPVVGASQQVVHNDIKVTNGLSPQTTTSTPPTTEAVGESTVDRDSKVSHLGHLDQTPSPAVPSESGAEAGSEPRGEASGLRG